MSKTPLLDAARAAYEPIREREQTHHLQVQAERKTRAEGHFHRVFGVPQEAVLEDGRIVFTIDGYRLQYVGNLRRAHVRPDGSSRPVYVGPGWMLLEKCGGCRREQPVVFVQTLADLGRVAVEGIPDWECQTCNR